MKNVFKRSFALVMTLCLLFVSVAALAADDMTAVKSAEVLNKVQALAKGSKGEAVRALTYQLKQHGYLEVVPGTFNDTVKAAVLRFQWDSGLTANGVVDQKTIKVLLSGKGAVTDKPVEEIVPEKAPGPDQSIDPDNDAYMGNLKKINTIKKGEAGQAVRALTYQLNHYGYIQYVQSKYDATVEAAVRHFQSANGLAKVDGIANQEVVQKLLSGKNIVVLDQTPGKVPAQDPNVPATTDKVEDKAKDSYVGNLKKVSSLAAGAKGQNVRALTYLLQHKGYIVYVQNNYDGLVKSAVSRFQYNNGLKADGVANKATIDLLLSGKGLANKTPEQNVQELPVAKPEDKDADSYMGNLKNTSNLQLGAKGQVVRALTYQLQKAGYITYVTNSYNETVANAVSAFQAANGLGVTGIANQVTITRILGSK